MKLSRACLLQRPHVLAAEVSTGGLVRTSFSLPDRVGVFSWDRETFWVLSDKGQQWLQSEDTECPLGCTGRYLSN